MFSNLVALSAAVLLSSRTANAQTQGSPCASMSSMSVDWMSAYPESTAALVPAPAAEDCLKSIPVDVTEDQALIEELLIYAEWVSNLAYLSNPPEGYKDSRSDLVGALKKISEDLGNGKYEDEFTLQLDLSMAYIETRDFHTTWVPDVMGLFTFRRGNVGLGLLDDFTLVSVSSDGKELPKLYNYYDILVSQDEGWTASPIAEINNQTAEDFIEEWSGRFNYLEDHTRYNQVFPNQALISMGQNGNEFGRSQRPNGEYTTIKHENGSTLNYINTAVIPLGAMDSVEVGQDLFDLYLNKGPPKQQNQRRSLDRYQLAPAKNTESRDKLLRRQEEEEATRVKRQAANPTATGYPAAETLHSEGVIGGYYLSGNGYDDVAVLSVPSFSPSEGVEEFQNLVGDFLKGAKADGKKKLVIDLRGNGGGRVFLGYDLFKQLFPSLDPYGASRFRANDAFDQIGKLVTEGLKDYTYEDAVKDFEANSFNSQLAMVWKGIFNYRLPLTIDNKNFTSWEEYFGPHEHNGDKFTTPARWDLLNFFSDDLSMDITGYRTRAGLLEQTAPFEADNIVLLQDGACGSTCAVFSEFAKTQGGIQQVVVGGLPKTGPMQGVAGSKGSQVYYLSDVREEAAQVYDFFPDKQEEFNNTDLGKTVWATRPLMRSMYQPKSPNTFSGVNLRDNIRMGDKDEMPLEFVYEAADCRLFYTADMVRGPTAVWKKAVDARWGDAEKTCVEGSTKDKSSISGGAPTFANNTNGNGKKGAGSQLSASTGLMAAVVAVIGMLVVL